MYIHTYIAVHATFKDISLPILDFLLWFNNFLGLNLWKGKLRHFKTNRTAEQETDWKLAAG